MGAQTEKRRQMFIQRYEEVENSEGEGMYSALHFSFFFLLFTVLLFIALLLCRRFVGTMPLLYPLLLGHHRCLLPCQDGAIFTHLPDTAGEALHTRMCNEIHLDSQIMIGPFLFPRKWISWFTDLFPQKKTKLLSFRIA